MSRRFAYLSERTNTVPPKQTAGSIESEDAVHSRNKKRYFSYSRQKSKQTNFRLDPNIKEQHNHSSAVNRIGCDTNHKITAKEKKNKTNMQKRKKN